MKVLNQLGFRWHENGAVLSIKVDGKTQQVFVPLHRLTLEFGDALASVGCPLLPAVGFEPYSVGGLFSRIKRAVKRGVKKAVQLHTFPARALYTRIVPRAIRARAMQIRRAAVQHVRRRVLPMVRRLKSYAQSPYAGYAAMALSAFPATAPVGASMLAARSTMSIIDRGQRAAQLVQRGIRRPGDLAAMARAQAQRQAVQQLGSYAQQGNPQAMQFFGALQQYAR